METGFFGLGGMIPALVFSVQSVTKAVNEEVRLSLNTASMALKKVLYPVIIFWYIGSKFVLTELLRTLLRRSIKGSG